MSAGRVRPADICLLNSSACERFNNLAASGPYGQYWIDKVPYGIIVVHDPFMSEYFAA